MTAAALVELAEVEVDDLIELEEVVDGTTELEEDLTELEDADDLVELEERTDEYWTRLEEDEEEED